MTVTPSEAQGFRLPLGGKETKLSQQDNDALSAEVLETLDGLRPPPTQRDVNGAQARLAYFARVLAESAQRVDGLSARVARIDDGSVSDEDGAEVARNGLNAVLDVVAEERKQLLSIQERASRDLDLLKTSGALSPGRDLTEASELLFGLRRQLDRLNSQERTVTAVLGDAARWQIAAIAPPSVPPAEEAPAEERRSGEKEPNTEDEKPEETKREVAVLGETDPPLRSSVVVFDDQLPDERIYFDRPHVTIKDQVRRFLARPKGSGTVRVMGVSPQRLNDRDQSLGQQASAQYAEAIKRSLVALGFDEQRIETGTATSTEAFGPEVHLFWER